MLGSYVDDAFGGARAKHLAQLTMDTLTITGRATGATFNLDKSEGPATELVVLGLLYSSKLQACRLGANKRAKYLERIDQVLSCPVTTSSQLAKLAGNLSFAA